MIEILGVNVCDLTFQQLLSSAVTRSCQQEHRCTIMYANAHTLNSAYGDPVLRDSMNTADMIYCDGAGVVIGASMLGHRLPGRMTGADWIYDLCVKCAAEGKSLYLLGSRPNVARFAVQKIASMYPDLKIAGFHHGFFHDTPEETEEVILDVNRKQPDILLVGMGTPKQEKWIATHRNRLDVPIVWAVGALFDFVAGVQRRGPRWMLDHGLEWLYRLISDPRRLWRRYLLGNPLFIFRVLKQRIAG